MSETLTRPEQYTELQRRRQLTGKILANPCWFCRFGVGMPDLAQCREFLSRTFKNCVEDGMQPKFELNEDGRAELERAG